MTLNETAQETAFTIAPAKIEDVEQLAALHANVLAGQLTRLGPALVQRFYGRVIDDRLGLVTCAQRAGVMVGFVITAHNEDGVLKTALRGQPGDYAWLLRHSQPTQLARSAMSQLFSRAHDEPPDGTSLMYIGLAEHERGSGLAGALLSAAEDRLREAGTDHYWLRVRCDNPGAINFYFKNGFRAAGFEAHTNQLVLTKTLMTSERNN